MYGKAKFRRKKLFTKTLFTPTLYLAMVVSGKVSERRYQGLFESGPKKWTFNLKFKANYVQRYLKIHNFNL